MSEADIFYVGVLYNLILGLYTDVPAVHASMHFASDLPWQVTSAEAAIRQLRSANMVKEARNVVWRMLSYLCCCSRACMSTYDCAWTLDAVIKWDVVFRWYGRICQQTALSHKLAIGAWSACCRRGYKRTGHRNWRPLGFHLMWFSAIRVVATANLQAAQTTSSENVILLIPPQQASRCKDAWQLIRSLRLSIEAEDDSMALSDVLRWISCTRTQRGRKAQF